MLGAAGGRAGRGDGAPERWPRLAANPSALEAGEVRGIGGLAASTDVQPLLLAERSSSSSERFGHAIRVVGRGDDQEVDRAHVAAGDDRRTEDEQRPADELASRLGDEDARVRQVDELPKQVGGVERARRPDAVIGAVGQIVASRSMSVMRAARTRYSTPKVGTS